MPDSLWKRLFFWKPKRLSQGELQNIQQEADHLTAAVDSTQGQLKPEDMERLKALSRMLQDATKRLKSD